MASLLAGATKTAHHLATSLLSAAEVKVGSTIPVKVPVKEDAPDKSLTFESIKGKNVFVRHVYVHSTLCQSLLIRSCQCILGRRPRSVHGDV